LDDPALRARIRQEMETTGGWENWYRHVGHDWNRVIIGQTDSPRYAGLAGQSIAAMARAKNEDPWDTFFSLVQAGAFALPESMTDANKILAMQQEFVSFCTDVGPAGGSRIASHPRAFGAFPRLISRYVRDLGAISLERAVAQASAAAANHVMAYNRGRIAEGLAADLIVFDYEKLADKATFAEPSALSEGMQHVLVNGVPVLKDGKYTGLRPGRVLRGPGYRPASDSAATPTQRAPEAAFRVRETEATITVSSGDSTVLVYNKQSPAVPEGMDRVYARSGFLHPVASPRGTVVTASFPLDHPHQHGIFSAWVKTTYGGRSADFWNLPGRTGRVLHERVVSTFEQPDSAGFEVDLLHRLESNPPVDVLRERWKVTAHRTDPGYRCLDLETVQSALTDTPLVIDQYHYGGLAVRGPVRWLTAKDGDTKNNPDLVREPSEMLNSLGSDRIKGNHEHARWVALTGTVDGRSVSIAALSHQENFRAPQAARLHPTKPYFCFAPCVDGQFQIDRNHPLAGRYRFLITDAPPDPKWLEDEWRAWHARPK
jgi:hypothetical protein